MTAAEQLAALAHQELLLVYAGRVDELGELHARRDVVVAALPVDADPGKLSEALQVQRLVDAALAERLADVRSQLAAGGSRREAAAGYARTAELGS